MRIRLKQYQTYSLDASGFITSARLVYHCNELGSSSTADILRAVKTNAAAVIENSAIASVELVNLPAADCCDVAVNYGERAKMGDTQFAPRKRKENEILWSFDVGGGTATVRTSLFGGPVYEDGDDLLCDNVADYVGWNGKFGEAFQCSGVNILVPNMRETCRRTVKASTVDATFRRTLGGMVGKVNSATFHGWDAGEVLFAGATLSAPYVNEDGDTLVDVSYSFNIRTNEANKQIAEFTPIPSVEGWDYAWGITGFDPDEQKNVVKAIFVSQVYERADLTDLGIGGSPTPDPDPDPDPEV